MLTIKPVILAIDDEADMLKTYHSILNKKYNLLTADSGEKGLKIVANDAVALVLLDICMPKQDGITILKKIKELDKTLDIIMITASKEIASAVEAMKLGALDYLTKPFEVKELWAIIEKALEKRALAQENLYLRESLKEASSYQNLIGKSAPMLKLYETIERVAPTDSTVLITGESGSGKELVARAIHNKSKRAAKPFVALNCAAIPENLFESELFGHERGAFTSALERKIGKFELANEGTLFLDEIGCLPGAMQAKLLRVLEERVIERLGGEKGIPIDVRLISATNIDFSKNIASGKFRQDLYYRLNVIPISLPPLKARAKDIPLLIEYFLDRYNKILNKKVKAFAPEALDILQSHSWPGNVRELQNLIERVVVLSQGETIQAAELPLPLSANRTDLMEGSSLKKVMEFHEKKTIQAALAKNKGNISQTAKDLKIARTSLITRMKHLGLIKP